MKNIRWNIPKVVGRITIDDARDLINQYDDIDDAIAYADKQFQDTQLGYWRQVKERITAKKNNPLISI